jgi:heme A synthase
MAAALERAPYRRVSATESRTGTGLQTFRALVLAGAISAYALAMLGSWTRINGAGMTCPDWPLCHGAVVPALHGKIVLEWLHRLFALLESLLVAGVVVTGIPLRRAIPALSPMLRALAALFVLQVLLGAITIWFANSPPSVMVHWGTATLLLATFTVLAVIAFAGAPAPGAAARSSRRGPAMPVVTAALAFAATCAGAYVSSSGAGFACTGLPGCGDTFFGATSAQAVHMLHRFLGSALAVLAVATVLLVPRSLRRTSTALRVALVLVALQVTLGILMVQHALPSALREAHAANAIATFLAFVVATTLAELEATRIGSVLVREEDLPRHAPEKPAGGSKDRKHDREIADAGEAPHTVPTDRDGVFGELEVQPGEGI